MTQERETTAAPRKSRTAWRGVKWPPVRGGKCSRHGKPVTPSGICMTCHREQLEAARNGSREWERAERHDD